MNASKPQPPRPPLFALIFMSMFGFIGLAVFIGIWFGTARDFPPLFFKLIASFIAIAFMAVGFGTPISAWKDRHVLDAAVQPETPVAEETDAPPTRGYKCPNCGAGLGPQEVSPKGDVKCTYCQKWWNIHEGKMHG